MRSWLIRIAGAALLLALTLSEVQAGGFTATIWQVAWSPDGQSLLYMVYEKGTFIVNLDGESQQILDANSVDGIPQWSPDGKSIISTMQVDNQGGIFLIPLAGGEPQRLTQGTQPVYSPDNKSIAFLSRREGDDNLSLYSMTADGDDEHRLTEVGDVYDFAWSPDSKAIVFTAATNGDRNSINLFLIDSYGTKLRSLTTTSDVVSGYLPAWTPDGKRILFTVRTDHNPREIDLIDADGENRKVLREQAVGPIYSPDGKYILFTSPAEHWFNLSIINADNTEADPVVISQPGEHDYYNAAWSPDSSHIAFVARLFDAPESENIVLVNADGTNPQTLVSLPLS